MTSLHAEQVLNPYNEFLIRHIDNVKVRIRELEAELAKTQALLEEAKYHYETGSDTDKAAYWLLLPGFSGTIIEINSQIASKKEELSWCQRELEAVPSSIDRSELSFWQEKVSGVQQASPWRKLNPGAQSCFIATAAYGSPNVPEIEILREFRDAYLLSNPVGEAFVYAYYVYSPFIAKVIAKSRILKRVTILMIAPVVTAVTPLVILSKTMMYNSVNEAVEGN